MSRRSSLTVLAVLAASGALIAGCTSSSSSSTTTPTASATSASASAPATSASAGSTAAGSSTKPSAADCTTISSISAGVVSKLLPLEGESPSKAAVAMKAYIATLTADEAKLTSTAGKAALGSFITSLEKSLTETQAQATPALTTAIGNLASACS